MASLLLNMVYYLVGTDRRGSQRKVPMKVLVLGLSRTGTMSLKTALRQLGIHDVYHMSTIFEDNPRDAELWIEAFEAKFEHKRPPFTRDQWDQILGDCMALSDAPCLAFMEELVALYPEAKIILTLRDSPEQWCTSVEQTLMPLNDMLRGKTTTLGGSIYNLFAPTLPVQALSEKIAVHMKNEEFMSLPREERVKTYGQHNDHVRDLCKDTPGRLLEMNVKQGWKPLCAFLDVKPPVDSEGRELAFPRVNDTQTFRALLGNLHLLKHALVATNVLITAAIVGTGSIGAYRLFTKLRR